MNARVLITTSGWIAAAGLLVMFMTAHNRYRSLQAEVSRLKQSNQVLAYENRAQVRQQANERALHQARTAVPRPVVQVQVRERDSLGDRLNRVLARRSMLEKGSGEVAADPEQSPESESPALSSAANDPAAEETGRTAAEGGSAPDKKNALKNTAFLSNLDRMIADLDRTIEAGRKEEATEAKSKHVSTAAHPAPGDRKPVTGDRDSKTEPAPRAVNAVAPEVQVIYVHPFGNRKTGTWVKYHRFEKAGGTVKFFFSGREVFSAPGKAVEWEQRVMVN